MQQLVVDHKNVTPVLVHPFPRLQSTAVPVRCYVCNKGIEDDLSLVAKTTSHGTVFVCDNHC